MWRPSCLPASDMVVEWVRSAPLLQTENGMSREPSEAHSHMQTAQNRRFSVRINWSSREDQLILAIRGIDTSEQSTITRSRRLEDEWLRPTAGAGLAAAIWPTLLVAWSPLADAAAASCAPSATTPSASTHTVGAATGTAVGAVPACVTSVSAITGRRQRSHDVGEHRVYL